MTSFPRPCIWTIDLPDHGIFSAMDLEVQRNMKGRKRHLAQSIVDCYGGGCGNASTKSYWLTYPKMTLAVVLAGIQFPLK